MKIWKKKVFLLRKVELDLEFLVTCREKKVIARFSNFCWDNKSLRSSYLCAKPLKFTIREIREKRSNFCGKSLIIFAPLTTPNKFDWPCL